MSRFFAYSRGEIIADMCVHAVGLVLAVIGSTALLVYAARRGDTLTVASVVPYVVGLLAMLTCSTLYNAASPDSPRKGLFRRADHAAIFLMIAGTYTPLTLNVMPGPTGYGLLAFVWTAALAGIVVKLFMPTRLERFTTLLYLALSWSVLGAMGPLLAAASATVLTGLVAGGLLYSAGVAFHGWHRLPYHNPIWHVFVVTAAACHYVAILSGMTPAV